MKKILKRCMCIVFITMLVLSLWYMSYDHDYEISNLESLTTEEEYKNISYEKVESLEDENILGILTIEKINLIATVKEGSTQEVLKEYIGHISETNKYDGNVGLAAHNRLNKYSYFARLNELEKGDKIIYKTKFYIREYVVNKKGVIYDTDWSCLENTNSNKLTMITCIANKPNERLYVQAIEK